MYSRLYNLGYIFSKYSGCAILSTLIFVIMLTYLILNWINFNLDRSGVWSSTLQIARG